MKNHSYITFPSKDKKILGINSLNHDSCITLLNGKDIQFSAHSERYSGIKNDEFINQDILSDMNQYGEYDTIVYYEQPYLKKSRQLWAHQYSEVFQGKNLPSRYLKQFSIKPTHYIPHHLSHVSAAYFTSPYRESIGVVIDAIGEWDTASIWSINTENEQTEFRKLWSMRYPSSIGLWYSSITQRLGLKPQEDEYILMGMAGWGIPNKRVQKELRELMKMNLHRGCMNWDSESMPDDNTEQWKFDIACNTQIVCEEEIMKIFKRAKRLIPNVDNFVYGGGVALNCVANSLIVEEYPNLWILPNPGDGGSSLGSAAFVLGEHVNWNNTFLGYDIKGKYPYDKVLKELYKGNIVGVANGRAEYGPRALGNRSLLADPRGDDIKDKVNKIKKRQEFRPFAPAVLEEHAHKIFEMPVKKSQYMQFVAKCKYPDKYPAICHVDGTSRVQTVSKEDNPNFYKLIKEFYKKTGCPMLLNTSLNIKGMPIVNTHDDAIMFEKKYGIKVF
jgi:carbamoyltransferase